MNRAVLTRNRVSFYEEVCKALYIDKNNIILTDNELILDNGVLHLWCNPNTDGISEKDLNGAYTAHESVWIHSSVTLDKVQHSHYIKKIEGHEDEIINLIKILYPVYEDFKKWYEDEQEWHDSNRAISEDY